MTLTWAIEYLDGEAVKWMLSPYEDESKRCSIYRVTRAVHNASHTGINLEFLFTERNLLSLLRCRPQRKKKALALLYTFAICFVFKAVGGYVPGVVSVQFTISQPFTSILSFDNYSQWIEFDESILAWGIIASSLVKNGSRRSVLCDDTIEHFVPPLSGYTAIALGVFSVRLDTDAGFIPVPVRLSMGKPAGPDKNFIRNLQIQILPDADRDFEKS
ncbi:hypothetical protein K435DRAFT_800186 [Dendrothele bispora CBS 962.96]|uniref:Uncharacterized protein n=1 Tax=Dendrothele bispora (strain CBS 962.96) TaxID=1314807 RepID=A0A4V4HEY7_DENBC|nr:hypothetical protein K435DRAFT_800186 [Dendrothele bispora CBS 962.96]